MPMAQFPSGAEKCVTKANAEGANKISCPVKPAITLLGIWQGAQSRLSHQLKPYQT